MATKEQILEYMSTPRSDKEIAEAMVEHRVTPDQLRAAVGETAAPLEEINQRFAAALPGVNPYTFISEAIASPKVTAQQYQDLSNYFSNQNVAQDTNQQRDFIGNKSGYDLLNYLMTRDAVQGGGDPEGQYNLFQQAIQPFMGAQVGYQTRDVYDSESSQPTGQELFIANPYTGADQVLTAVDAPNQVYKATYGELGRATTDPAETGYFPQVFYQLDPETGTATIVGGGPNREFVGDGGMDFVNYAANLVSGGMRGDPFGMLMDTANYLDYTQGKRDLGGQYINTPYYTAKKLVPTREELEQERINNLLNSMSEERRAGLASLPRAIPLSYLER